MSRIYISGVSGSGKTAACRLLIQQHSEINFINSSQLLLELTGLKDSRQLKDLSPSILENIRQNIFPKTFNQYPNLIVDGHLNLIQEMVNCFDTFINIEAQTEKILSNRNSEPQRIRSTEIADIDSEINQYRNKLELMKSKFNIKPITIHNEGSLEDLANRIYAAYCNSEINKEVRNEISHKNKEF